MNLAPIAVAAAVGALLALWPRLRRSGGSIIGGASDDGPLPPYAPRDFQTTCDPTPKAHVVEFRDWILANYGGNAWGGGIARSCKVGGKSEHKEGRALDWSPKSKAQGDKLVQDLLASDAQGRPHALARKWGVQYLIWHRRMWRAYSDPPGQWFPYKGASPHTDHVHLTIQRKDPTP